MTIFRFSATAFALLLAGCGSSVDNQQTAALVQLDKRVANLEQATQTETGVNNSESASPTMSADFMNIANNLAAEKESQDKQVFADQRLRNIEDRLERLETQQREIEAQEMARNVRDARSAH